MGHSSRLQAHSRIALARESRVEHGIIGREQELAAVGRLLDRARDGPAALVIDGEAGIGKTTVWLEALRAAEARGLRVLQARPAETEAKLSYSAVADLVGAAFDETEAELPPPQRRALAAALLIGDAEEPADARTISAALVAVVHALASRHPVLLAVDDVQWLDAASHEALAFAARRLPSQLTVVLARRSGARADLPLGLERALPDDRVEHIVLGPLSLAGLHHLIRSRLGMAPPRPLLMRLFEGSGGNPFFALEIARALRPDRPLDEPLPVPRSVEELVEARVEALSLDARRLALAAAALSHPTVGIVVDALAGEVDTRAALIEAEEAGVLVADRDRLRFAHPLLASGIYRRASDERRRQLHERLATLVSDAEERAHHLALSALEADEQVAAEIEKAAVSAKRRGAHQAAAELFAASRRLTPEGRMDELTRRSLGEAAALIAAGDVDRARALAEAETRSPVAALQAEALYLLGEITWISGSGSPREHFEAALAAAPEDRELASRIYPKLVSFTTHDPKRAVAYAEAAMRLLSPERHPGPLAQIVFDRFWAEVGLGHGARWDLFEQWRELEAKAGPDAPKTPLPLICFWSMDDFEAARRRYAIEEKWYRERGHDLWRAERLAHLAMAELRAGEWKVAARSIEEACDTLAPHIDQPGPWGAAFRIRSVVDAHLGRTGRARATIEPFIAKAEDAGLGLWEALGLSTLGFIDFVEGDHRAADRTLTKMHERTETVGVADLAPDRSEPFHVESLVALGEVERAHDVLARLEERGRKLPRLWITVTLPRVRAFVLAAEGDVHGGLAALDELDPADAAKLPFELAWNRLVQGRLHRRVKQKRAAGEALREALTIFERLGAPTWVEQTRAELGRLGLRRAPAELTPTELRVAELAATGMTNREVASAAFMSPKTVEANLVRVYRKLGIASRAELGARMADERRRMDTQT
jgi:DNA-binding CsgD family transcriptional regulator